MSKYYDYPDDVMELKGSATIPGKGTVEWYAPVLTPEQRKVRTREIGDGLAETIRKICQRRLDEGDAKGAEELWRKCFVYPPPPWLNESSDNDNDGEVM